MINIIRLLACVLLVFTQVDQALAVAEWSKSSHIVSKILKETRSYRVLLPMDYDANQDQTYPLLLLLDGQRYGDVVAGNARFLEGVGEIPEHIIVAVDSGNRMRDFTPTDSPHWEGDGGAKHFLNFLSKELLPAVDRDFRIKRPHVIWGHSLGGLFAFYTLYAAPNLFDAHLVNDGTLDWDEKAPERGLRDYLQNKSLPDKFLYFNSSYLMDVEDPELRFFETLSKELKLDAPPNLRWVYEPMPKESHASIPLLGSIHGLRTLYDGYYIPESEMLEGLDAILTHYEAIKGRVGAPDKVPESVLNAFGYFRLGQDESEALRAFELATKHYPESANAWDSLSDGYLEAGRLEDALKATEKSIEIAEKEQDEILDYVKQKRNEIQEKIRQ